MSREMKNSGIPWIGDIPKDWEMYRIKYNTFLKGRIGWQGLNSNDFIDEGYCLITGTDFDNKGGINWHTCYRISKERFYEDVLLHVKNGDLLMTKDGTVGKMAYIKNLPEEASLNSHLLIIRQTTGRIDNGFLYWIMLSDVFKRFCSIYQSGSIMNSISQSTLGLFCSYCPSIIEQQKIASFLDRKCAEIDEMIALQEKIVEELKAYKQSVITEAVTKGLNTDVPMKNSGVEWIGEIPEHWKQCRLKNYFHLHGRIGWNGLRSDEFEESSYAYLVTGQDFKAKDIDWKKCYQIRKERYDEDPFIQLTEGDILVTKDGTIGKVAVVKNLNKPACLNSGIFVVKQYEPKCFDSGYVYWLLVSPLLKTFNDFLNLGGTTIIHLYQNVFERMPLVLPPLEEQQAIANHLDKICSEIDSLIRIKESKIDSLKEYKKSIIYEYVTGKKEVTL